MLIKDYPISGSLLNELATVFYMNQTFLSKVCLIPSVFPLHKQFFRYVAYHNCWLTLFLLTFEGRLKHFTLEEGFRVIRNYCDEYNSGAKTIWMDRCSLSTDFTSYLAKEYYID